MEWISVKERLPETEETHGFNASKVVAVLVKGKTPEIAEYQNGIDEDNGEKWEQWWCPISEGLEMLHTGFLFPVPPEL